VKLTGEIEMGQGEKWIYRPASQYQRRGLVLQLTSFMHRQAVDRWLAPGICNWTKRRSVEQDYERDTWEYR